MQLALAQRAAERWRVRNPGGHQPQPFCVRVGSPHAGSGVPTRTGYASRLGPVRRLPAGNSPNGTSWSSDGSLGPVTGSSRSEQACARSAANAACAFQRWFRACRTAAAHHCARWRALACASSRKNFRVPRLTRPPTSTPTTTRRQREPAAVPGKLGVCGRLPGRRRGPVGGQPWAGLAIPSDWAHDCGIHRDLGALPNGESIGDNLYAASVAGWYIKVEVTDDDVRCNSGSRLFADACCCSLEGAGSAG